jgi:hypothetical protein
LYFSPKKVVFNPLLKNVVFLIAAAGVENSSLRQLFAPPPGVFPPAMKCLTIGRHTLIMHIPNADGNISRERRLFGIYFTQRQCKLS